MNNFIEGCWWAVKTAGLICLLLILLAIMIGLIRLIVEKVDPPKEKKTVRYKDPPDFLGMSCALLIREGQGKLTYEDGDRILYLNDIYINCEDPDIITISLTHMKEERPHEGS